VAGELCHNVDDIICKDVKPEERRGCTDEDQNIISKNMSLMDTYHFAKSCFKSSVSSFVKFFTEFIPELLRAMWNVSRGLTELSPSKMIGFYETTKSLASDVYEEASQNPGEYMSFIWTRMVDVIGPMVASYDCLKPQLKVERICGFVAGWIVPPTILAKVLIRGSKFIKESVAGGLFLEDKLRLQKALELAEKRPKLTYKQYDELFNKFRSAGYSDDEILYVYRSNTIQKYRPEELASRRKELLSGYVVVAAAKIKDMSLYRASNELTKNGVGQKVELYRGEYQVIKVLPDPSKNNPTWVKMVDALDKKHNIPTTVDPVLLKKAGASGALVERPGVRPIIALDPKLVTGNPEDIKIVLSHEAVHASGTKKFLAGKIAPDNNLKMQFQLVDKSLIKDIPTAYASGFSVDEVKAYSKQARILKSKLKNEGASLNKTELNKLRAEIVATQKVAYNFARSSLDLLNKTEDFLMEKKFQPGISYARRGRTEIFDVQVKVTSRNGEPFTFTIPIYDAAAAKTGRFENINQKLLKIIQEAKKTVRSYQE
jgi:hypothetical protein